MTNLATQSTPEFNRATLTQSDLAKLAQLRAAIPKEKLTRNYAQFIGIDNNLACVTDGYRMLTTSVSAEGKATLGNYFEEIQGYKFPNFRSVLPTSVEELASEKLGSIAQLLTCKTKSNSLQLRITKHTHYSSIVAKIEDKDPDSHYYDLRIISDLISTFKKPLISAVTLSKEGKLTITINKDFTMLFVPLKF